jgi:hypothetical protein
MTGDFIDQEIISNKRDLQLSGLLGDNKAKLEINYEKKRNKKTLSSTK